MSNKKNILLVANWDSDVGYAWWLMENFWCTIAQEYSNKGYACFLIYPSISIIPKTILESPIQIIQHDYEDQTKANLNLLKKIIHEQNIGYVYLSDKPEISLVYLKLKCWGVKKIAIHDHTPGDRETVSGLKYIAKKCLKILPLITADLYIAVTEFVRDRMINSGCLPTNKCCVAKNGIQPIKLAQNMEYYCHDEFGLAHDSTIIISTGRACYYKQVDFLILSFAKLCNDHRKDNVFFIFCGDGSELEEFKYLAIANNVQDKFIFAGQRNDISKLLQSCDIGIQSSKGEVGYSLSILEYMSAGLATLVPSRPSTCQSIIDNKSGLIFKYDSIESAVEKLLLVVNNEKLRSALGENARKSVENNFNLDNTNKSLLECLSRIIN